MKIFHFLILVGLCLQTASADLKLRQDWTRTVGDDWRYQLEFRQTFSRAAFGGSYWRQDGELPEYPHMAAWLRFNLQQGWRLGLGDWRPPTDGVLFGHLRSALPSGSVGMVFRPKPGRAGRVNPEYRGVLLWRETGGFRGGMWWASTRRDARVDGQGFLLNLRHGDRAEWRVNAWRDRLSLLWLEVGPWRGFDFLGLCGERSNSHSSQTIASFRLRRRRARYNAQIDYSMAETQAFRFRCKVRPEQGFSVLLFADCARGNSSGYAGFGRPLEQESWNNRFGISSGGRSKMREWELGWFHTSKEDARAGVEQRLRFRQKLGIAASEADLVQTGWLGVLYSSKGEAMTLGERSRQSLSLDLALLGGAELRFSWTLREEDGEKGRTGRVRIKSPREVSNGWRLDWRIDSSWHEGSIRDWQVASWWPGGLRFQQLSGDSYRGGVSMYFYKVESKSKSPKLGYEGRFGIRVEAGFRVDSDVDVRLGVMCSFRQKNRHLP